MQRKRSRSQSTRHPLARKATLALVILAGLLITGKALLSRTAEPPLATATARIPFFPNSVAEAATVAENERTTLLSPENVDRAVTHLDLAQAWSLSPEEAATRLRSHLSASCDMLPNNPTATFLIFTFSDPSAHRASHVLSTLCEAYLIAKTPSL